MATEAEDKIAVAPSAALDIPLQIAIPVAKIVPWAIVGVVLMGLAYYFVGAEQGATSVFSGMGVHEFVHDARHLLGLPLSLRSGRIPYGRKARIQGLHSRHRGWPAGIRLGQAFRRALRADGHQL